jgi:hypothetical protein
MKIDEFLVLGSVPAILIKKVSTHSSGKDNPDPLPPATAIIRAFASTGSSLIQLRCYQPLSSFAFPPSSIER